MHNCTCNTAIHKLLLPPHPRHHPTRHHHPNPTWAGLLLHVHRDLTGPDPQVGTAADTYNFDEYRRAMLTLMLDNSLTAARSV